ncbi:hypothetical protein A7Q10_03325 [Methylacidiphilum caldifontis]|uniref:Uncharacterized protein n=1 Tax=Methylacidiphilum caldifontis TaxID=2795386 RepID=A0A4Y8PHN7_9BACT|nr:hypothetical protein A7Q10_03325 [Methylacidiphilum caldifontis]
MADMIPQAYAAHNPDGLTRENQPKKGSIFPKRIQPRKKNTFAVVTTISNACIITCTIMVTTEKVQQMEGGRSKRSSHAFICFFAMLQIIINYLSRTGRYPQLPI